MPRPIRFPYWLIIILLAAFAVGYWAWSESLRDDQSMTANSLNPLFSKEGAKGELERGEGGEFQGWQTYRNEEYGFEVKYPDKNEIRDFTARNRPHYPQLLLMIGFCESDIGVDCVGGLVDIFKGEQKWEDKWARIIYKNDFTYIISGENQIISTFKFLE